MIRRFCFSPMLMLLVASLSLADEQHKVQRLLTQVTAMATDPAGRRAVSLAMSDSVSVSRADLARQRSAMGVNYGELFLVYQLVKSGAKMNDIAAQTKGGKTVWKIAEGQNVNWKEITSEAKKLNNKLDINLLKHFANRKPDADRDRADGYDPFLDSVNADRNVTEQDIEDAQKRYIFLRDHAGVTSAGTLDTSTEKAARGVRTDPIRNGGPDTTTRPTPNN